jgi:hypothetical protein
VQFILCPVNGQWNKSRAINIVLKGLASYFLVGDVDLIFDPEFIRIAYQLMNNNEIHYFSIWFYLNKVNRK